MSKKALVCGAGGFIGGHLVTNLKTLGYYVVGVDIKNHEHKKTDADRFVLGDLTHWDVVDNLLKEGFDEIYQLAADMGGATYIFTGEHDADIMYNSVQINLNVLKACVKYGIKNIFYSSSACVYPEYNQMDPDNPVCVESSAYPANPDSEYGWEKLFSERLYLTFKKNYGLNVKIARFHNIFGPLGTWTGGKEKSPAALCRKVAVCNDGDYIEVMGDGKQTRSFLFVQECVDGILKLMSSEFSGPVNIGSEEMVTIEELAKRIIKISGKHIEIRFVQGPQGVRGRNSDNRLIREKLGWEPQTPLVEGLFITYKWINSQVHPE